MRLSESDDDAYSISVVQDGQVRHIRVLNVGNGFCIKWVFSGGVFPLYFLFWQKLTTYCALQQGRHAVLDDCGPYSREAGREDQEQVSLTWLRWGFLQFRLLLLLLLLGFVSPTLLTGLPAAPPRRRSSCRRPTTVRWWIMLANRFVVFCFPSFDG